MKCQQEIIMDVLVLLEEYSTDKHRNTNVYAHDFGLLEKNMKYEMFKMQIQFKICFDSIYDSLWLVIFLQEMMYKSLMKWSNAVSH